MKTVTIRQIHHDFSAVLALVAQGEEVTVLNRTRPVARICPPHPEAPAKFKMPHFAARAKAIFGDTSQLCGRPPIMYSAILGGVAPGENREFASARNV